MVEISGLTGMGGTGIDSTEEGEDADKVGVESAGENSIESEDADKEFSGRVSPDLDGTDVVSTGEDVDETDVGAESSNKEFTESDVSDEEAVDVLDLERVE